MNSREVEVCRRQLPRSQHLQIVGPQFCEFLQQQLRRPIHIARAMTESIVRLEARIRSAREDDARPRNPIRLLAIDQVSDDIERAESARPFHSSNPFRGDSAEERVQCCRCARRTSADKSRSKSIAASGGVN